MSATRGKNMVRTIKTTFRVLIQTVKAIEDSETEKQIDMKFLSNELYKLGLSINICTK